MSATASAFDQADFFAIPLLDGGHGLGQIVEVRDCPPDTAFCALTLRRATTPVTPLALSDITAIIFVGTAHLADGTWPLLGFDTLPATETLVSFRQTRRAWTLADTPATLIAAPALIEAFVNACHGLLPWDHFPDPQIFDRILAHKVERPPTAGFNKAP
jgi:hypothetical protein